MYTISIKKMYCVLVGMMVFFTSAHADFQAWKQDFAKRAKQDGIQERTLQSVFYNAQIRPKVIKSDRNQAEFRKTFGVYIRSAMSEKRMQRAKKHYNKNFTLLNTVYEKYGVHPRYLVAFWGLETNFGNYLGNSPVIESLVTLAYDKRRRAFFEQELLHALHIVQDGHVASDFKGSWAGAFGHLQFMPSTFVQYAIDGNQDGKIDLFHTPSDYFHSAANFLSRIGWRKSETWGREVRLPKNVKGFDWDSIGHGTKKSMAQWADLGITYANGTPLNTAHEHQASLLIPQGAGGPKFLVFHNFRRILNWNRSDSYALAIGLLSNHIMDYAPMSWTPPKDSKGISVAHIKFVQLYLKNVGFYTDKVDGILGKKTQKAIQIWQKNNGHIPDGYITNGMIGMMRNAFKR